MVRTQVQLTETQSEALKRMAARRGVSVAKIIRESVDEGLKHGIAPDADELRRRAVAAAGCGHSGKRDISTRHDDYLDEAFGDQ